MKISHLDHRVLTVADIDCSAAFYCTVPGMERQQFGDNRTALHFGRQKINRHLAGQEFEPGAHCPQPGSADLCFIVDTPLTQAIAAIESAGVTMGEGPVQRSGADGPVLSVYLRIRTVI